MIHGECPQLTTFVMFLQFVILLPIFLRRQETRFSRLSKPAFSIPILHTCITAHGKHMSMAQRPFFHPYGSIIRLPSVNFSRKTLAHTFPFVVFIPYVLCGKELPNGPCQ